MSTALGIASAADGPTVALLGDLCFLHDANGLLGAVDRGVDATFVVVDNGGGGIFSFLPQSELAEHFETLFATPQPVDLAALAGVHGIPVTEVASAAGLEPALRAAVDGSGVNVVRVRTDRDVNVTRHREVWSAVADSLSDGRPHCGRQRANESSGADEGAEHRLELGLGLGPLRVGVGAGDDARPGHEAGA